MSFLLWVMMPIAWALAGKLIGLAIAASCFFNEPAKRIGKKVSAWCVPLFPIVLLALLITGASGNAGHGFKFFDSEVLFELACGMPIYAILILGLYVALLYVVRDSTLGHGTNSSEVS